MRGLFNDQHFSVFFQFKILRPRDMCHASQNEQHNNWKPFLIICVSAKKQNYYLSSCYLLIWYLKGTVVAHTHRHTPTRPCHLPICQNGWLHLHFAEATDKFFFFCLNPLAVDMRLPFYICKSQRGR